MKILSGARMIIESQWNVRYGLVVADDEGGGGLLTDGQHLINDRTWTRRGISPLPATSRSPPDGALNCPPSIVRPPASIASPANHEYPPTQTLSCPIRQILPSRVVKRSTEDIETTRTILPRKSRRGSISRIITISEDSDDETPRSSPREYKRVKLSCASNPAGTERALCGTPDRSWKVEKTQVSTVLGGQDVSPP